LAIFHAGKPGLAGIRSFTLDFSQKVFLNFTLLDVIPVANQEKWKITPSHYHFFIH